jgi:hypothetical protein
MQLNTVVSIPDEVCQGYFEACENAEKQVSNSLNRD